MSERLNEQPGDGQTTGGLPPPARGGQPRPCHTDRDGQDVGRDRQLPPAPLPAQGRQRRPHRLPRVPWSRPRCPGPTASFRAHRAPPTPVPPQTTPLPAAFQSPPHPRGAVCPPQSSSAHAGSAPSLPPLPGALPLYSRRDVQGRQIIHSEPPPPARTREQARPWRRRSQTARLRKDFCGDHAGGSPNPTVGGQTP